MSIISKNRLLALALILCIGIPAAAQSPEPEKEKPFRIGAGLGYSFTGYREETYSPVNRYVNALTYTVDGSIEKGNFFHSLNLGFFIMP